jgi:transcriptional regulator with XRE-family HTH domain
MESTKLTEMGRIIQTKRVEAGFTQKSLANALHITDKAVSKWERGICLPDVALLSKLALLLDVDVDILVAKSIKQQNWSGLLDINNVDFSQIVYDKPLVYYLLSHYLLLGITKIYVLTDYSNERFLKQDRFRDLGFQFVFKRPKETNLIILNQPWFVFGSDLTQQFQGAMMSERNTKLVPDNQAPIVFFSYKDDEYFNNQKRFIRNSAKRTLGRGMVCINANSQDSILDIASFVRTYQSNSKMLIGSLEEISYKQGLINEKAILSYAKESPYGEMLSEVVNHKSIVHKK